MAFAFPYTPKVILMEIYTQTYTFILKKLLENIYWVLNVWDLQPFKEVLVDDVVISFEINEDSFYALDKHLHQMIMGSSLWRIDEDWGFES